MTYEERYDKELKDLIEGAAKDALIGYLRNEDGQIYGRRYDGSKLTDLQKQILIFGRSGEGHDVWNQVWFENPK